MMNFDFNLKAHIQVKDGEYGQLAGLVIYPEARLVTALIAKQGLLMSQQRVVPIGMVQSALGDDVYVAVSSHELDQCPEYRVVEYEEPVTGLEQRTTEVAAPYGLYGPSEPTVPTRKQKIREGITSDQKVIEPGMPVENLEGKIGKVVRAVVSRESNEIIYLVAQRGMVFHEHVVVPITMVEDVSEDNILVTGTDEMLEELPQYKDIVEADFLAK